MLNEPDEKQQPENGPAAKQDQSVLGAQEATAPPAAEPVTGPPPQHQPEGAPAAEAPPKTVQEMMEKSAKSAGDGLSQTQK
ncbi:MAG TPA: hypothetical protein PKE16_15815, partial [Hyphomicrobium sp.]|nr:hypothetical protein [Hyphomicrobium sp.]